MISSRNEKFSHLLGSISLTIPTRHTLKSISPENMSYIITIFFAHIDINILRNHLPFPVSDKTIIDHDPRIIEFSNKYLEHREPVFITHMIVFIIPLTRWDNDDFFRMFFREERLHDRSMSDMRRIKCSTKDVDH